MSPVYLGLPKELFSGSLASVSAVILCIPVCVGAVCGAEKEFYNIMVASHSLHGSISVLSGTFTSVSYYFFSLWERQEAKQTLEWGKHPSPGWDRTLVKCVLWKASFRYEESLGEIQNYLSYLLPDRSTRSFSYYYCGCLERKPIKVCLLP